MVPYYLLLLPLLSPIAHSGIPFSSDALSRITRNQMRGAVISFSQLEDHPLWLALPLLSGSPCPMAPLAFFIHHAIYSTVTTRRLVTSCHGIVALPPWPVLKSTACRIEGHPPLSRPAPKVLGLGNSLRQQATVVKPLSSPSALGRNLFFSCYEGPAAGFLCSCTSLCWFSSWFDSPILFSSLV